MLMSRKFLIRALAIFSFFVPFSTLAAEEKKWEDPSIELASKLGGISLGESQHMSVQAVVLAQTEALVKIESIPPSFKTIEFDVSFKEGKARVRPCAIKDINDIWIERICRHDPTDPMDKADPDAPLPTKEKICEAFTQLLSSVPSIMYGIYNDEDGQIMGMYSFCPGRYFYHAIESTIRVNRDFRGRGIATNVVKGMLEAARNMVCEEPLFYIEASINSDNEGSIKSHVTAGMIPFNQGNSNLYYYPLREGLGAPTSVPSQEGGQ